MVDIYVCAVSGELIGMQCGATSNSLVYPASGMYLTLCTCVSNYRYYTVQKFGLIKVI